MSRLSDSDIQNLNELADRVVEHSTRYRIERYLTALDRDDIERSMIEAVRAGTIPVPSPAYEDPPADALTSALQLREGVDSSSSPWHRLLADDVDYTVRMWRFLDRRDAQELERLTIGRFGLPGRGTIAEAHRIIAEVQTPPPARQATFTSAEAAAEFSTRLASAGLSDWSVVVEQAMNARMSVNAAEGTVRVRAGQTFTPDELSRLIVHELATHVLRAVNGANQPLQLLRLGLDDYLTTEEGLALWHEEKFGVLDQPALRTYALRVVGVELCRVLGIGDAALQLAKLTTPEEAVSIALRAKRGVAKMGRPGAHVKDHVYLSGLLAVRRSLAEDPSRYRYLISAKCSLSQIDALRDLEAQGRLNPPTLFPEDLVSAA